MTVRPMIIVTSPTTARTLLADTSSEKPWTMFYEASRITLRRNIFNKRTHDTGPGSWNTVRKVFKCGQQLRTEKHMW